MLFEMLFFDLTGVDVTVPEEEEEDEIDEVETDVALTLVHR